MSNHSTEFKELINSLDSINIRAGSIVTGHVINIDSDFVTVDANMKSESLIPLSEFKTDDGELSVSIGDDIDLMVESVDNGVGESCLSREKAVRVAVWNNLMKAFEDSTSIMGKITDRVKGGFTVDLEGVRAFLPGSQVDLRPVKDLQSITNKPLEFKIVKVDKKRNNVVVSRRAVIENESNEERDQLLESLHEGMEISGIVKNLTDYGAFIDLGGIDGLLHITDMSWKRLKHPSDMISVGDELKVKVLSYDREKKRVSLGLKQLQGDPWYDVIKEHPVNSRVFGRVSNITEYGCFVEISNGIEGLVHQSEMDWTNKNINPSKVVELDQEIEVMILDVDDSRRRISLGIKQCKPNPWKEYQSNHEVGERVSGNIRSVTDFGIFIGLEGEIDGLVHLSDLSWTQSSAEVLRNFKKGQSVEAVILSVDSERERISLGIKQLSDDPFEQFINEHAKGSSVSAVISEVDDKKILVNLPFDLVGQLKRSDFDEVEAGQEITCYVASSERKNMLVQLTAMAPSASGGSESGTKDMTTLGDLMKGQLDDSQSN